MTEGEARRGRASLANEAPDQPAVVDQLARRHAERIQMGKRGVRNAERATAESKSGVRGGFMAPARLAQAVITRCRRVTGATTLFRSACWRGRASP